MTELKLQNCRIDGRYEVLDCLGGGSYAEIYVARDCSFRNESERTVVIKALNVLLHNDEDPALEHALIENFQNEAIALDRVRHPNIINRLGHGTAIDLRGTTFHYLVLEYMSGGDLAVLSRHKGLTFDLALFYLEQVCAGLAHAHSMGVIHRDIKPQNLLLTADKKTLKIADFGVAKLEATEGTITRVGSNIFAAPEHSPMVQTGPLELCPLNGAGKTLTPAADIYSLAKTTYALLAGEPPRRFTNKPISELPPSLRNEVWSPSLLRVLMQATQDSPLARFQTVQEFWAELSDAALAPTQLLNVQSHTPLRSNRAQSLLSVTQEISTAPPKPLFETNRLMQQLRSNGGGHPRIVVPFEEGDDLDNPQRRPLSGEDVPAMSPARAKRPRNQRDASGASRQSTRLLVGALLIVVFAGMLFALYTYIRAHPRTGFTDVTQPVQVVGQEGTIVSSDVKLRPFPNTNNPEIGVAEQGSRVRVLNASNNWLEVYVIEHGREKSDPGSSDRGWVNKKYLKF